MTPVVTQSRMASVAAAQADSGQHVMPPTGKQTQHAARIVGILRLAENLAIHHDGSVGAEYGLAVGGLDGLGLGRREPLHVIGGLLAGEHGFVDTGHAHGERDSGLSQNLAAPRRLGGKHQHLPSVE